MQAPVAVDHTKIDEATLFADALAGVIRVRIEYPLQRASVRKMLEDRGMVFRDRGGNALSVKSGMLRVVNVTPYVSEYAWFPVEIISNSEIMRAERFRAASFRVSSLLVSDEAIR